MSVTAWVVEIEKGGLDELAGVDWQGRCRVFESRAEAVRFGDETAGFEWTACGVCNRDWVLAMPGNKVGFWVSEIVLPDGVNISAPVGVDLLEEALEEASGGEFFYPSLEGVRFRCPHAGGRLSDLFDLFLGDYNLERVVAVADDGNQVLTVRCYGVNGLLCERAWNYRDLITRNRWGGWEQETIRGLCSQIECVLDC